MEPRAAPAEVAGCPRNPNELRCRSAEELDVNPEELDAQLGDA
jgi:hypothetical protein